MGEPLRFIPVLAAGLSLLPVFLVRHRVLSNPANASFAAVVLATGAVNAGGALMVSGYGAHLFAFGQAMLAASLLVFSIAYGSAEKREALVRWSPGIALAVSALLLAALFSLPEGPVAVAGDGFVPGPGGRVFQAAAALALMVSLAQMEGTFRAFSGNVRKEVGALLAGAGTVGACYALLSIQLMLFGQAGKTTIAVTSLASAAAAARMALSLSSGGSSALEISVSRTGIGKSLTVISGAACILASLIVLRAAGPGAGDYFTSALIVAAVLLASAAAYGRARMRGEGWPAYFRRNRHDYKERWLEATEKISSLTDPSGVKTVLSEMVSSSLGASNVNVWLYDQGQECFFSTSSKLEQRFRRIPPTHRLVEQMLETGSPFYLSECGTDPGEGSAEGLESFALSTGAAICAPLAAGRELIGFLSAGEGAGGRRYARNDLDLLRAVATQAAVQIKNLRLSQDLLEVKEADAFSRMSSFVMHDLKNFTNSLALLSHNARSNIASPEFQKEAVKAIDLTVARMKGLIEKMAGGAQLSLDKRPFDLRAALERAVERLPSGAVERLTIDGDGGCTVCSMDPEAVETVFFNLLMNAFDAVAADGEIGVAFQPGEDSISVRISDTGSGIARSLLEKGLFRPFSTTKKNGFGVGLYQCKAVMEAHGGRIEVESEEGTGTVFTLKFPLHAGERLASSAC